MLLYEIGSQKQWTTITSGHQTMESGMYLLKAWEFPG